MANKIEDPLEGEETSVSYKDGDVLIERLPGGKHQVKIFPKSGVYSPDEGCITDYPVDLIRKIGEVKGAAWLCNEIARDEKEEYLEVAIRYGTLGFVEKKEFGGKKILDFGCGCGASTSILARLFPGAEITGLEYMSEFIEVAEMRKSHYGFSSVEFQVSPSTGGLPPGLGTYDFILMCGVFEHLLPDERRSLFPDVWSHLKPGGVMFINHTPNSHFPVEFHTTSGLMFLNYLPDKIAHSYAAKFSSRNLDGKTWEELLRDGIRGATKNEILDILNTKDKNASLLKPRFLELKDDLDVWYKSHSVHSYSKTKRKIYKALKFLKGITGIELTPYLSLAIRKAK